MKNKSILTPHKYCKAGSDYLATSCAALDIMHLWMEKDKWSEGDAIMYPLTIVVTCTGCKYIDCE